MMTIGVVGLGTMGLGIAQVFAQAGNRVLATDADAGARDRAMAQLAKMLESRVKAGKLAAEARDATLAALDIVPDPEALASASLVIEAVREDLQVKRALMARLEGIVGRDTILATNTSSLSVSEIARDLRNPARVLGLHFFNPPPVMKLVELATHAETAPAAVERARRVTEAAGKTVIACADRPGFIVNRCARPFYGEALSLLEDGRSPADIDAAMLAAGYKIGPFSLMDLIGADINLAATEGLAAAMGGHPRYHVFAALRAQVASGDLGRKSGRGFIYPDAPGPAPADAAAIALRIEAALANEAADLLAEGHLAAQDIDTAMRLGLNFPRGPFESARRHGFDRVVETLKSLEAAAPPHLKGRYLVNLILERLT
ncbi:MAG: 3-hydroxybutyryl-CoA dehydrogenase [Alphaproteobacteria bacterium]|nr:3-hydroxybutyryl-CoA dehydrogenase [Alphaproteobacteria bacterium]